MKKIFSIALFLLIFTSFRNGVVKAENLVITATNRTFSEATLGPTMTSASTQRVKANNTLNFTVQNLGEKYIHYKIFKEGKAVSGGLLKPVDFIRYTQIFSSGDYSLRVYCGYVNKTTTDCRANTYISGS